MTAIELIHTVEAIGGRLVLDGPRLRYHLPPHAEFLLERIRVVRSEVCQLLAERQHLPTPPKRVRIVQWELLSPPISINSFSIVNDIDQFARSTLSQLGHALEGRNWLAGNWTVRDLVERLEQVGVKVEVTK